MALKKQKQPDFSKKLFAIIKLIRVVEWTKAFGYMLIALIAASLTYGFPITENELTLFLFAVLSVSFLWGALYTINDITDAKYDSLHPEKKHRPIPSGIITKKEAIVIAILLILASFFIAFYFVRDKEFPIILFLMLLVQVSYTLEPIRLKERPIFDVLTGSLINVLLRFYASWLLFVDSLYVPILYLVFISFVPFGGYIIYRLMSADIEKKLYGFKSSSIIFNRNLVKGFAITIIALGILSFFALIINGFVKFMPTVIGYFPPEFMFASLTIIPFWKHYEKAIKDPEKTKIKAVYKKLYLNYFFFILAMFFIFVFVVQ